MEAREYLANGKADTAAAALLSEPEQSESEIVAAAYASDVARLERMMKKQADDSAARMASLERMIEGMARAVAMGAQAPAPVHQAPAPQLMPAGLDQVLAVVKALRDVAAPAPQTTMADTMQMMLSVLDLREKIAASVPRESGDGSGFGAMLPALIGPLATMLERESNRTAPAAPGAPAALSLPPGRPAAAVAAPAAAPAPAQPLPGSEMDKSGPIHELLTALPLWAKLAITQQAAADVDPAGLVDHVLAMVPDDALDKLAEAIESVDDATEEIVMRIPKWIPYKAWLRKLLTLLHVRLLEELQDEPGEGSNTDTGSTETGNTDKAA